MKRPTAPPKKPLACRQGRTGKRPTTDDTFLWRICHALDVPPRMLAAEINVPYSEIHPLLDERHLLVEIDRDETWWKIAEYVDRRVGELMAARMELSKALQRDRTRRALRIDHLKTRQKKPSPRS